MRQEAKINIVHVPFKGAPEAVTAVMRGDVQIYFAPIPSPMSLSAAGKVRVLAINSAKRAPQLPDVPTVAEAALPNYHYEFLVRRDGAGRHAAGDPQQGQPGYRGGAEDAGVIDQMAKVRQSIPAPTTPAEFDKIITSDTARYTKVMADAGIAPQ